MKHRDIVTREEMLGKLRERTAMIEELIWAMHVWSQDEDDTIHPDAWGAFAAALQLVGIEVEEMESRAGFRYVDLDWVQRQRDQWRKRQAETDQRV